MVMKLSTINTTAANKTLSVGERVFVTQDNVTITLPSGPSSGDAVGISVGDFSNTLLAQNGDNIMNLNEDLAIDIPWTSLTLVYVDATKGWRII